MSEEICSSMGIKKRYLLELRYPKAYLPPDLSKILIPTGRRWNDLPEDLVGEIMVRLSSPDRIRLAACCTSFKSLIPVYNQNIDQIPWMVQLSLKSSNNPPVVSHSFHLFDPIHQTPYSITCVPEKISGDGMIPLCYRHGWLLFLRSKQMLSWSFVLVSPFTKQIITLPDLDHTAFVVGDPWSCNINVSYSCDPLSPECVYFVLWEIKDAEKVSISTFRNGDTEWNTGQFNMLLDSFASVVYHEENFYCVSSGGNIAAYNIIENKWGVFTNPELAEPHRDCRRYSYLLVCEGKLVLVFLDAPGKTYETERFIVFEYVQQKKGVWVEKTRLGDNNALYLCRVGSFSVSTSFDMANRICYPRPYGVEKKYYQLEDGKTYAFERSCWPGVERLGTWIEPPQLGNCSSLL